MPVVYPTGAPMPVAVLGWDGTDFRALLVDAAHRLQIDVVDAAGIQDALQSVATDRLIVRGENQLHAFGGIVWGERQAVISGANGYVNSNVVGAGRIWHLTRIVARDLTSATTAHDFRPVHDGVIARQQVNTAAFAANIWSHVECQIWLDQNDYVRVYFTGGLVGDTCGVLLFGEWFTAEV